MHIDKLKNILKLTLISSCIGILASLAAAFFLVSLEWITVFREMNRFLIFGLPFAGLLIGYIYHNYGKEVESGNSLILSEIHEPKKVISLKMAPFIYLTTLISHLFGASVGREGVAVQMGASLSDQVAKYFKITPEQRRNFLIAGAGAGFGSAIGVPFAGLIFGMEFIHRRGLKLFAWYECLIASLLAYITTSLIKIPHLHFSKIELPPLSYQLFFYVLCAGVLWGLMAQFFSKTIHFLEQKIKTTISYPPLRPFLIGIVILIFYYCEGSFQYTGLGLPEIQKAFLVPAGLNVPFWKLFFTILAIASGFRGGEFTPLVFIGTTLGSAFSVYMPLPINLLASLGFVALFAGAANTPITCTIMAIELFGPKIAPLALIACFASYYVSGKKGIYKKQQ